MIYTSYFAQLRNLPKDIIPISICSKAPVWYSGLQYKKLAPKYEFFTEWKKNHDNDFYIKCFNEQVLSKLNSTDVVLELKKLAAGFAHNGDSTNPQIVLICYEKPEDFCHRHLVSMWLNDNGFECKEWVKPKEIKND